MGPIRAAEMGSGELTEQPEGCWTAQYFLCPSSPGIPALLFDAIQEMSESVVAKAGEKQTLDKADVQIKPGYLLAR